MKITHDPRLKDFSEGSYVVLIETNKTIKIVDKQEGHTLVQFDDETYCWLENDTEAYLAELF